MIASSLGNIVGGGLFVGTTYWYLYLTGEERVQVSFGLGAEETAVEGGAGPMRKESGRGRHGGGDVGEEKVVDGVEPQVLAMGKTRSGGSAQMVSGIGRDLADDGVWAKKFKVEAVGNGNTPGEKV